MALQLGAGEAKAKRTTAALRGHFAKANVAPKRKIAEFRVAEENLVNVGEEIIADHYFAGQFVDIAGTSIGKGFAGAMKRHNFGGLRASHGVSISHRSHGSTGQCQDPGKVFKGKKMAGHLGAVRVTTQNLQVVRTDADRGLIMVKGSVPGSKGGWVTIKDAVKKPLAETTIFPAATARKPRKPRVWPKKPPLPPPPRKKPPARPLLKPKLPRKRLLWPKLRLRSRRTSPLTMPRRKERANETGCDHARSRQSR